MTGPDSLKRIAEEMALAENLGSPEGDWWAEKAHQWAARIEALRQVVLHEERRLSEIGVGVKLREIAGEDE